MAILWLDGFEGYGSTPGGAVDSSFQDRYAVPNDFGIMDVESGRYAGSSLEWPTSFDRNASTNNLGSNSTLYVGMAVKFNSIQPRVIMGFWETGSWFGMNRKLDPAGYIKVYRGTTRLANVYCSIRAEIWYYLEFKVTIDNSVGAWEVRLDGESLGSATNVDTRTSGQYLEQVILRGHNGGPWYDDFYVSDSGYLDDIRIDGILPDSAGDDTDWTPDSGNNYERVDENPPDDDTSYVETSTSTDRDLYNYESLPSEVDTVKGLQINTQRRVTAGTETFKTVIKTGTTTDADAGESTSDTSYDWQYRISETDPDTASAWTESGVNAAQFGVEAG